MVDCMTAVGTPEAHASALADVLVAADCRGHYSHGLNRLGKGERVKSRNSTSGTTVVNGIIIKCTSYLCAVQVVFIY